MKIFFMVACCVLTLALISCGGQSTTPGVNGSNNQGAAGSFAKFDAGIQDYRLPGTAFHTDAHKQYLADPMDFKTLPDGGVTAEKTAVVGSQMCQFYPDAVLNQSRGTAELPTGVAVPFGTILPIIGERISDPSEDHGGMFSFQENWNWFYHTEYKGNSGLVFGSDLYGLNDSAESNRISAHLYNTQGRADSFFPILGYQQLGSDIINTLQKDKLAIQTVRSSEYSLYSDRPDDMISLYLQHKPSSDVDSRNRKTPVFVTTDLAAHAQHLVFDRLLQHLEETYFAPRLKTLCQSFVERLKARSDGANYPETLEKAILYFQTAQALIDLAPEITEGTDENTSVPTTIYKEKDAEKVLASYPQAVRDELALLDKASGFADSVVLGFKNGNALSEDYSQYKPRGHYTKNGVLSAYFRAMMWFGRIHFLIATGQTDSVDPLALALEPIALLVTDTVKSDPALYKAWEELFDPITALIGQSDDLSFREVMPLWNDQKVSDFGAWASNKDKLISFMKLAHEKLRPPAISGNSVFTGPSEGADRKPPMGWRLFGQRFTYDSSIHHQVSPPRLMSRDMVTGLDIMKAFGSKTADQLLAKSDYPKMAGLQDKLNTIEKEFSAYDTEFWTRTFYNQVLYLVKSQAQFEPGAGFYFTESPAWGIKAMLSSHGTWAELRHDTILYVKQSYAERSGDGDFEPTFRTEPIPDPVHYIEPNLSFWQGSVLAVQKLGSTLGQFAMLDEESASILSRLHTIFVKSVEIVGLEAQDAPVPATDVAWIATIPAELVHLVTIHAGHGDNMDPEQLKMALIADVYTNAELGKVLEVGVGIPNRLYVPLNDKQGGKRIAVGYTFSYYEFPHPMSDRMTDEAWKKEVYATTPDMAQYLPFWAKDAVQGPVVSN